MPVSLFYLSKKTPKKHSSALWIQADEPTGGIGLLNHDAVDTHIYIQYIYITVHMYSPAQEYLDRQQVEIQELELRVNLGEMQ